MENKSLKNITFLISGLTKGGSERVISVLSNLYSKQNITVNVISMRSTGCYYDFDDNVNIEYISPKKRAFYSDNPINTIKKLFKLTKVIKKSNTDIVVAFGESSCLYAIGTKFFY